jgi:uncharacterized protein YdbL (DUF1318 family)
MRKNAVTAMAVAALIILPLAVVFAEGAFDPASAEDLKARFNARNAAIVDLKAKGIVGENNKGFLEFVGGKKEKQGVVAEENSDRLKVYTAIAKRQGTSPEAVGIQRAIQISKKALPGDWLQDANGKWYQK